MTDRLSNDRAKLRSSSTAPDGGRPRSAPGGLPRPLTSLVAREREVAATIELLERDDVQLVTLTGPGGVGKTRVAIQAARELEAKARFAGGIRFVSLAPVRDPELVGEVIAQALGLRAVREQTWLDRLVAELGETERLLVLDNLEQVVAAAALLAELLEACPRLKVLATSRETLRVAGGHDLRVPPLSVPRRGVEQARGRDVGSPRLASSPSRQLDAEAVQLFVERAGAVDPGFALTDDNAATVVELCRRLDGLPLAIELAAARLRHFSPGALLERLVDPPADGAGSATGTSALRLLKGGPRNAPERHRSLRGAIAWSHDLLSVEEQAVFRHLAVFAGGFVLEAAEAVIGEALAPVLDHVLALVDKSLLQPVGREGSPRFAMLETIREYGLGLLAERGELAEARRRHAAWCRTLVERVAPNPFRSLLYEPDGASLAAMLATEHDNLREALTWTLAEGDATSALRLAGTLSDFWYLTSQPREGRLWLRRALDLSGGPDALRVKALAGAALLASVQGDHEPAVDHGVRALTLAWALDDPWAIAESLAMLGNAYQNQGRYAEALPLQEEALDRFRQLNDESWLRATRHNLAVIRLGLGDIDGATADAQEALALARVVGDAWGIVNALGTLGELTCLAGDPARAAAMAGEALRLALARGEDWAIADALCRHAQLAYRIGQAERAARLLGAAEARYRDLQIAVPPPDQPLHDRIRGGIRERLGPEDFAAAHEAGGRLSLDEAVAEADAVTGAATTAPHRRPLRVILVDDHAAFRQPLAVVLGREPDLEVVGEAGSVAEARALVARAAFDVAVVDLGLPDGEGAEVVAAARAARPGAAALVLTGLADRAALGRAAAAGAAGAVAKARPAAAVAAAVRAVGAGRALWGPGEAAALAAAARREAAGRAAAAAALGALTRREREVLAELGRGRSNAAIGRRLHVGADTVKTHVASVLRKLGVGSRVEAALFAARHGLVPPDPEVPEPEPEPEPAAAIEAPKPAIEEPTPPKLRAGRSRARKTRPAERGRPPAKCDSTPRDAA